MQSLKFRLQQLLNVHVNIVYIYFTAKRFFGFTCLDSTLATGNKKQTVELPLSQMTNLRLFQTE